MASYLSGVLNTPIPQSQQAHPEQVKNSAGGWSFAVSDWTRLDRFLILGAEGNTYYATERQSVLENSATVMKLIAQDGKRVVERTTEISVTGRAPKNDQALYVLALAVKHGDEATRKEAYNSITKVARIPTHLFQFLNFLKAMDKGWSRGLRTAVANWYIDKPSGLLEYYAIKYRQRDGWTHADTVRLSHPKTDDEIQNTIFRWMLNGWDEGTQPETIPQIWAFEMAKTASKKDLIHLITEYKLPWEAVDNKWLNDMEVLEALMYNMPLEALVRNLPRMTARGLLTSFSNATKYVMGQLRNGALIHRSRMHPINILIAEFVYSSGRSIKGDSTWNPVGQITNALDDAFYLAFPNITPANKRTLIALDVSGSMATGYVLGIKGLTPRVMSAAMAMATARSEPMHKFVGFSSRLIELKITANQALPDVIQLVSMLPFDATDCALPMMWAMEKKQEVDTFIIYTDSETQIGKVHPHHALSRYRKETGINSKLVVVGMVSNKFTIANPNDAGMLDVVGFDSATPAIINDFSRE